MINDRCRWAGSDRARVLVGRHEDGCAGECDGCLSCSAYHCRVCNVQHSDGVCGGCLTAMRDDLADIERMYDDLPAEVTHRGINGEAMNLLGPCADVEAWGHREASAAIGRTAAQWTDGSDDLHPEWVLGNWSAVYREAFDHDEPTTLATVSSEAGYLRRNLTYIATWPHVPVEDMARDLRRCRAHLEAVLHDGEQIERSQVPCLDCGARLEQRYGQQPRDDHHVCPRCRRTYTGREFDLAKAEHLSSEGADRFVPIAEAVAATGRSEWTVRTWLRRGQVRAACEVRTHRLVVWWPDVRDTHRARLIADARRLAG